ncbi:MAG: hypothetical protein HQL29_01390 [Candidatus Omnitrophica bacterium]|nr:hypothetical protein [Candidatus Omnitrophota bacterium]
MLTGEIRINKKDLVLLMAGIFVICMAIVFVIARCSGHRDGLSACGGQMSGVGNSQMAPTPCNACGQWGLPSCPQCNTLMQFNPSYGVYACPGCQRPGVPYCANCMRPQRGPAAVPSPSLLPQMQPVMPGRGPVNVQNPVQGDPMMPVA